MLTARAWLLPAVDRTCHAPPTSLKGPKMYNSDGESVDDENVSHFPGHCPTATACWPALPAGRWPAAWPAWCNPAGRQFPVAKISLLAGDESEWFRALSITLKCVRA